jgi:hypothetical protein
MKRAQLIAYNLGQLRLRFRRQVQESNQDRFPRQASHDAGFAEPMAIQKGSHLGGRLLVQRRRETQLVKQPKLAKSAAQRAELARPTAAIDAHNEFGKSERHFPNRSQESEVRSQNRNSKIVARDVTPAKAGFYNAVDSRLRGNDLLGGFRIPNCAFRFSSFEFRFSIFGLILTPDFCLLTSPLIP